LKIILHHASHVLTHINQFTMFVIMDNFSTIIISHD
jgi:hypothetical protein